MIDFCCSNLKLFTNKTEMWPKNKTHTKNKSFFVFLLSQITIKDYETKIKIKGFYKWPSLKTYKHQFSQMGGIYGNVYTNNVLIITGIFTDIQKRSITFKPRLTSVQFWLARLSMISVCLSLCYPRANLGELIYKNHSYEMYKIISKCT